MRDAYEPRRASEGAILAERLEPACSRCSTALRIVAPTQCIARSRHPAGRGSTSRTSARPRRSRSATTRRDGRDCARRPHQGSLSVRPAMCDRNAVPGACSRAARANGAVWRGGSRRGSASRHRRCAPRTSMPHLHPEGIVGGVLLQEHLQDAKRRLTAARAARRGFIGRTRVERTDLTRASVRTASAARALGCVAAEGSLQAAMQRNP